MVVAGQDCAYVRWVDAQTSLPGYQPLAGACGTRPAGTTIQALGRPTLIMRGPGTEPSTVLIFRYGPSVARVTARLADGRSVPMAPAVDGWGIVAADGRAVALSGVDIRGGSVPEQLVG